MKSFARYTFMLLLALVGVSHYGWTQQQITTLGTGTQLDSSPQSLFVYGNQLLFAAGSKHNGVDLWKTDGTEQGTVMVKNISLGTASSAISNFVLYKGKVYFIANDNIKGQQLWVTDGTAAGTMRVSNTIGQGISHVIADGNFIYLLRKRGDYLELWKSDGSSSGTILVKGDINIWNSPANLTTAGGLVYFTCQPYGDNKTRLWRSDGTGAGTFPITQLLDGNGSGPGGTSHPTQFTEYNGELYFVARGGAFSSPQSGLMKTDGTIAGTVGVMRTHDGSALVHLGQRFVWNGKMFFTFFEADTNRFIIVESDGTPGNSSIVYDKTYPHYFTPSQNILKDGFLYLTLSDGADGTALVKLNLTTRMEEPLKSIAAPVDRQLIFISERANTSAATADKIFFQSYFTTVEGSTLWVTQGTTATTVKLLDNQRSSPMTPFNDKVYFRRTTDLGAELWTSDGTVGGTKMVKDINTDVSGLNYNEITSNGKVAVFRGYDPANGTEPRITDGTVEGTRLLKNLANGPASSYVYNQTEVNGAFVFGALDNNETLQYYRSDGTETGTSPITSFTENKYSTNIIRQPDGKRCFFDVQNRDATYDLFVTDGTASGTQALKNFGKNSHGVGFHIEKLAMGTNRLYFTLAGEGEDLWMSDGTAAGTIKVADVYDIGELSVVNDKAYFVGQASSTEKSQEVYVSDGTAAGTKIIKDLNGSESSEAFGLTPFNGKLVFAATDDATGRELWITDGTEAGTTVVKDVLAGPEGSFYNSAIVVFKNQVYFVADDGVHGAELWRTSGTAETTTLFKDIVPGAGHSLPGRLRVLGDSLYFQAYTPEHGYEVWSSDGSADNTRLLVDVIPGPENSNPFNFIMVDDKLIFYADTPSHGVQLWSYSANTVTAVDEFESTFSVYPNPSNGIYRVRLPEGVTIASQIQVFGIDGRSIPVSMNGDGTLDMRNSPAGMYVIKIDAGERTIVTRVVKF